MKRENEIRIEKEIVRALIEGLIENGYGIVVDSDDVIHITEEMYSKDVEAVIAETGQCDEDRLYVHNGERGGWVDLVWGNVGDIIADYTVSLEDAVKKGEAKAAEYQ